MAEPTTATRHVVETSALPVLLINTGAERVEAASPSAVRLLERDPTGLAVADVTSDDVHSLLSLVQTGRLTGYETIRRFRSPSSAADIVCRVWVRGVRRELPVDQVFAVIWPAGADAADFLPPLPHVVAPGLFGTVSADLTIERVNAEVRLLSVEPDDLIGSPFLRMLDSSSSGDAVMAIAEASSTGLGVCLHVLLASSCVHNEGTLVIHPLLPAPSFAFSLVLDDGAHGSDAPDAALVEFSHGLHYLNVQEVQRALVASGSPGAESLAPRELEIIGRLLGGDRVPAIAAALFLSQSTVRNHLSSAFHKLRIGSQQELIDLYRKAADR